MKEILSYTMKNVLDARDGEFIHHDQYTSQLEEPEIKYCYANTIVLEVKSSHYNNPEYQGKGYGLKYKVFILLEDFYKIAKDKDIEFKDAVEYALKYGDVHVRCTCPAFLYWGYAYISTQLRYLYGLPRENRNPKIRNPSMKGTICKHADKAITYCLQNLQLIQKMFEVYYSKFRTGESLIAVDDTGRAIVIGKKNGNGDVFFEKQVEDEEELEMAREYEKRRSEKQQESEEPLESEEDYYESDEIGDPDDWWEEESEDDNVIEDE